MLFTGLAHMAWMVRGIPGRCKMVHIIPIVIVYQGSAVTVSFVICLLMSIVFHIAYLSLVTFNGHHFLRLQLCNHN